MQNQAPALHNPLPIIPDKIYFTIGEASSLCLLKAYVLRYWEKEFPQLSPSKRRGSRRYYTREEILLIRTIKDLLYNQGFTIEGARSKLSKNDSATNNCNNKNSNFLKNIVDRLKSVLIDLEKA
jgi:DNA-binding transcriptional MerR regulator